MQPLKIADRRKNDRRKSDRREPDTIQTAFRRIISTTWQKPVYHELKRELERDIREGYNEI
jgi:hypothetical protein